MIYIYKDTFRDDVYYLSKSDVGDSVFSFEEVENHQEAALGFLSEIGVSDSFVLEDRTKEEELGS